MKINITEHDAKKLIKSVEEKTISIESIERDRIRFYLNPKNSFDPLAISLFSDCVFSDCCCFMEQISPDHIINGDESEKTDYREMSKSQLIEIMEGYKWKLIQLIDEWEVSL